MMSILSTTRNLVLSYSRLKESSGLSRWMEHNWMLCHPHKSAEMDSLARNRADAWRETFSEMYQSRPDTLKV
jgi:hypothetical protein